MSATISLNRPCTRCPRVEQTTLTLEAAVQLKKTGLKGPMALRVSLDGDVVLELENLCGVCTEVVQNYLRQIGKKLQHRSALRKTSDGETVEVDLEDES